MLVANEIAREYSDSPQELVDLAYALMSKANDMLKGDDVSISIQPMNYTVVCTMCGEVVVFEEQPDLGEEIFCDQCSCKMKVALILPEEPA